MKPIYVQIVELMVPLLSSFAHYHHTSHLLPLIHDIFDIKNKYVRSINK